MSMSKQGAKQAVHTLMNHVLCGRFEEAKEMFVGNVEAVNLPTSGEHETLVYTILDAEEEGETVVVPVDLEIQSPDGPNKQTICFVCVETDEGTKIDTDMTLQKALGASPEELLEAAKEGLEGIVQDIGGAFEDVAQEKLAPELYSPDSLTDEFKHGLAQIADQFDSELESISDTLENADVVWEIAWGTMCDDEQCPQRLLGSVVSPLRAALAMLEDHRSQDPDAEKDASVQKVRANIKTIRIMNANDHRLCGCTLKDGRLTLMPCLMPGPDRPTAPTQGFTADEIEWSIRDALDLDVGPAIKRSEAAVVGFVADCSKDIGFAPQVTVDWESFRAIPGGREALDALNRLRDDLLNSVHYALFHLKRKVPFDACLKSLRFRNVESMDERAITVDGMTITFSVPMVERSTCYSTEEVQEMLADLVNQLPIPRTEEEAVEGGGVAEEVEEPEGVPEPTAEADDQQEASSGVDEPPANEFQQMVTSMESDMMGPMRNQMSQMFGKDFGLDVDWDSMDQKQDHFNLVVSGAMGAVMGALMAMAYDPAMKEPLIAAVDGMTMGYDPAVRGVALSLDDGILRVACGGPASEYTPDPAAMGEVIKTLLQ